MDRGSFKVSYSPTAIFDLSEIVQFIARDDAKAADRFGRALIEQTKVLQTMPQLGRPVRSKRARTNAREIIYGSYRIIYRVDQSRRFVEVARFWHAARGEPEF